MAWLESHSEDSGGVRRGWVWRRGQGQGIPGKTQSWQRKSRARGCSWEPKRTSSGQRNLGAEEELGGGRGARIPFRADGQDCWLCRCICPPRCRGRPAASARAGSSLWRKAQTAVDGCRHGFMFPAWRGPRPPCFPGQLSLRFPRRGVQTASSLSQTFPHPPRCPQTRSPPTSQTVEATRRGSPQSAVAKSSGTLLGQFPLPLLPPLASASPRAPSHQHYTRSSVARLKNNRNPPLTPPPISASPARVSEELPFLAVPLPHPPLFPQPTPVCFHPYCPEATSS